MSKEKVPPYPIQASVNPSVPPMPMDMASAPPQSSLMYPLLDPKVNQPHMPPPPPYSDAIIPGTAPPPMIQQELLSNAAVTAHPTYQHTTVVVQQPVHRPTFFPADPINIQCWYCNQNIRTRTKGHATCLTWLLCGVLCGIG